MKKFMKGCAITALILIVVGFVMAFTAGSAKGTVVIRDVVNSITGGNIQVDLTGINGFFEEDGVNYNIGDSMIFSNGFEIFTSDTILDFAQGDIRELDVEVGGCNFEIQESEDDKIYVEAKGTNKFQSYVQNGTLFLKGTIKTSVGSDFNGNIVLKLPADFTFEKVDMEMGAGVMELGKLSADKLDLEVGAGQITAQSIIVDRLELAVGMGEAVIDNMQVNKLEAQVGMGNFRAEGSVAEKVAVECAMGNVELEIDGQQTDYDYSIECGMGNVTIGENTYSGIANEKSINNGADRKMEVECAAGNIIIEFTE